jgi:peptidoglycan/xylan/chitin deacetylase (PgdA/CDA1 family)
MPLHKASADNNNLTHNPSVEIQTNGKPDSWTPDSWGSNDASLTYSEDGHTGAHSLSVSVNNRTGGDAKWMPEAVNITPGQTYTYSDYYMSDVATELDAQYTDASGNVSYVYLAGVPASNSWKPVSVTFEAPATAVKVSILHILATDGTLQTDDFSLTQDVPSTPPPNTDGNLIANSSFETADGVNPSGWQQGSWGTNSPDFSYLTSDGHTGTHSAKVSVSSYTSGDAKWYFNPVTVSSATQYTFSDYYKSDTASSIVAQYDDGNGNFSYQTLSSVVPSAGWQKATATFTTPSNTKSMTVFHLIGNVGSLQIDDAVLTAVTADTPPPPPPPPATGNLVPNPSLETADSSDSNKPLGWNSGSWGNNSASFSYLKSGRTGNRSVKTTISSYSSGSAYWYFDNQPVTGGQMYDFTDYYQSNVISEIDAGITMSDGSVKYLYLGAPSPSPHGWTKFKNQFTVPEGAVSITIFHNIYSKGWLTTDDFSLQTFNYQGFNRPIVSITDDDGYASFYNNGQPILKKHGLTSTDYIITGVIDNDPNYMTSNMVKDLYDAGNEIGSHSVTHPDLTTLGSRKIDNELKKSQAFLQDLLGVPVLDYAAPYGAYNQQVVTDSDKYYQSYRGVEAGYNAKNNFDVDHLMVQNILSTTTVEQVQAWLAEAKATNTWLILVYHQVDPSTAAGDYNTYPQDFDAQMTAIKASGINVQTVSQALDEIKPQL